ncbi:hypothetical protein [Herbiconiux flava]|uniref:Uncharacterized protein n=1 Tax=Herbiconiux flava TaxID=881268 RepID=A0A852SMJ4_9MICO|nr:hypothetical protein [Herbiconiux flava]NYD70035.1 hypothetical protein [Herbiconiux flava]GLK16785.1 hypothetical protein GCM10017602_12670 [Herbiconiux flava]
MTGAPATHLGDVSVGRRAVVRAAVWGAPVVALAVAAPLAAASSLDAGAYRLSPSCSVPGSGGPGFLLTAGPTVPLLARTTITVAVTGATTIGEVGVTAAARA